MKVRPVADAEAERERLTSAVAAMAGIAAEGADTAGVLARVLALDLEARLGGEVARAGEAVASAEVRAAGLRMAYAAAATVTAPIAGRIAERYGPVGASRRAGEPLFRIAGEGAPSSRRRFCAPTWRPGQDPAWRRSSSPPARSAPRSRGTVSAVSAVPLSHEGLLAETGDADLAALNAAGGPPVKVTVDFARDGAGRIVWTTAGIGEEPARDGDTCHRHARRCGTGGGPFPRPR